VGKKEKTFSACSIVGSKACSWTVLGKMDGSGSKLLHENLTSDIEVISSEKTHCQQWLLQIKT